jgi:hypothetical protein
LFALLAASVAVAQELPRPSMARHEDNNTLPTTYNMKLGPVLFDVTGSIDSEFNDNIGLTNTGEKADFLVTPEVGIGIRWPVCRLTRRWVTPVISSIRSLIRPISWSHPTPSWPSTFSSATSSSPSTTRSPTSRTRSTKARLATW